MELSKIKVSSSPHIRSDETASNIMLDVVIALLPALAVAIFVFGPRALVLTLTCVVTCVITEYGYERLMKRPITVLDGSAIVTGMLLAFCLPVAVPMWIGIIGSMFAIVIVKQLYGGIGKNFLNPALAARVFLMACWPALMTTWTQIGSKLPLFTTPYDVVTAATPLAQLKSGIMPDATVVDMALGMIPGCLGETSALALLAGGIYLLYRRVITLHTPLAYIGTVAVITFLFPKLDVSNTQFMLTQVVSGGLMIGAIFMASDYTTSPISKHGKVIYGVGCGLITVLIRYFGSYPESVSFAILIMNACVPLVERFSRRRVFGYKVKEFKLEGDVNENK